MSLAKANIVDRVILTPDKKKVILLAIDADEVAGDNQREDALQKKLTTYLEFVISGQFLTSYPQYADLGVFVVVVCTNPPTEDMKRTKGLRDHDRPETFLPVDVVTLAEFRVMFSPKAGGTNT